MSRPALGVTAFMALLFAGTGVALPFLGRWLSEARGLSGAEVGAVLASASLSRALVGPLIAAWADGFADRRAPLRLFVIAALGGYGAMALSHGFWALFLTGFFAATMAQAVTPLIEAAALRAGMNGRPGYGVIRGIGSGAFIFANIAGGALVARFGVEAAIVWLLTTLALTGAVGIWGLARDPAPPAAAQASYRERLRGGLALLRAPAILFTVLAAGLIQSSHGFYYGFSALVWRDAGLEGTLVGLLWAFGVAIEVGFLASLPMIERRFGPEALLVFGGFAAVVRWSAMALAPPLWALWPLQGLHALSFAATHVGAIRILLREAPESLAGFAQTLYAAIGAGTAIGLTTLLSGWLYDAVGVRGYGAMAIVALIGAGLTPPVLARLRLPPGATPPRSPPSAGRD